VPKLLIIKIWNYIRGYVVFRLEGLNIERVINLAVDRGVYLWDVRRIDYTTIEVKAGIDGYKEIRKILKRTGYKGKIDMKIGYPFFISKIKRKKIIALGAVISLFLVILSSSVIWTIDIKGNKNIAENDIIETLRKMGLYTGTFKYNINISDIENKLLIKYDKITWIGIEIHGTKATVKIIENEEKPQKIDTNIPCNIIAKKKGIIEKVIAKNGDAVVKRGDIVRPKQLLISGKIVREGTEPRYVHSIGEIYARTFYEKQKTMPLYKVTKNKTGKKHIKTVFKIGSFTFEIGNKKIPFKKYILEKKKKSFGNWRNIKIPVEIVIEEYYEVIEKKQTISEDLAKKTLKDFLLVNLIKDIPRNAKILNQSLKFERTNKTIIGYLIIEALEPIGVKKIININNEEINNDNKED